MSASVSTSVITELVNGMNCGCAPVYLFSAISASIAVIVSYCACAASTSACVAAT